MSKTKSLLDALYQVVEAAPHAEKLALAKALKAFEASYSTKRYAPLVGMMLNAIEDGLVDQNMELHFEAE